MTFQIPNNSLDNLQGLDTQASGLVPMVVEQSSRG